MYFPVYSLVLIWYMLNIWSRDLLEDWADRLKFVLSYGVIVRVLVFYVITVLLNIAINFN